MTILALPLALLALPLLSLAHDNHQGGNLHELLLRRAAKASSSSASALATKATKASKATTAPSKTSSVPSSTVASSSFPASASATVTLYAPGTLPPVKGAPGLPDLSKVLPANFPALDVLPPINSTEMQQWISQIDMTNPALKIPPTGLNGCSNTTFNAAAIANAGPNGSCWWSCGHCTRDTEITSCPNKGTWGVSYDDGPSPWTPDLLADLESKNLKATFFVVGSRVISRPEMVQAAYMAGHQISAHTWAHSSLTTLSNEGIIAELAWSKAVIKAVTGVTPNTNRVRYISSQLGMSPIIWTVADGMTFDTQDWEIAGGIVTVPQVLQNFHNILGNASLIDTGFVVLEHDLSPTEVYLSIDTVIPQALNITPALTLQPIITCLGEENNQAYQETFVSTQPGNNGTASPALNDTTSTSTSQTSNNNDSNKPGFATRTEGGALAVSVVVVLGALALLV